MTKKIGPFPLNAVAEGDCRALLRQLPADSIDVLVTSPSYWGQRTSLGTGVEADPREYVRELVEMFATAREKLKPQGIHTGAALRRVERDLRKDIAHALDAARVLLDGWRTSPSFDTANAITDAAKSRSLAGRIAEERRAQRVVEDAGQPDLRYG